MVSSTTKELTQTKLLHDHYTAPWKIEKVILPGQSVEVTLNGRRVRRRVVSTSHVKPFNLRKAESRHELEDEFSHVAWGADLGLTDVSVAASLFILS